MEAASWYESEQPGLGLQFYAAVDAAIDLIEEGIVPLSPLPAEAGEAGAKRLILDRFPYDVVVVERPDEAVVVAISHHSRKPGYWSERRGS